MNQMILNNGTCTTGITNCKRKGGILTWKLINWLSFTSFKLLKNVLFEEEDVYWLVLLHNLTAHIGTVTALNTHLQPKYIIDHNKIYLWITRRKKLFVTSLADSRPSRAIKFCLQKSTTYHYVHVYLWCLDCYILLFLYIYIMTQRLFC